MKTRLFTLLISLISLLTGCTSTQYIHNQSSYERQKSLYRQRSSNTALNIASCVGFSVLGTALEADYIDIPTIEEFKKINLINPTNDTMYVNMLTDLTWDKNDYCDFMDIRIPPKMNCKIMVPLNANYNIYFSNTPQNDDDEMLEIFTTAVKDIVLKPTHKHTYQDKQTFKKSYN